MPAARFWMTWSWRDLRKRLPLVLAIAAILGLGAGIFSGMGSISDWRRRSLDASLEQLAAHDIRVDLLGGLTTDRGTLETAVRRAVPDADVAVESRMLVHVPVTARVGAAVFPAAGVVVGVDLTAGPTIDRWRVSAGRDLTAADASGAVALLDLHFARVHHLPVAGTLRVGGVDVQYVGLALQPEYFNLNTTTGASIQGQATRAVLYTSVELARRVSGVDPRVNIVNDAVIRLRPGTSQPDTAAAVAAVTASLSAALPSRPATVISRADDVPLRAIYDEIRSEDRLLRVFALLVLAGAGFAAFNLTKRVVEAQRREIGIAMSLGVAPRMIAIRTIFFAAQVALMGVVFGLAASAGLARWVLSVTRAGVPLPVWRTPWRPWLSLQGVALAAVVPFVATALPLWRAVRVRPIDALLPPHLRPGRHRLVRLARRINLPGSTTTQAPFRRIIRAPARAVVTIAAISIIIAPLLAALGATDSTSAALRAGERRAERTAGDHLVVELQGFQTEGSSAVAAVRGVSGVGGSSLGFDIGGYLRRPTGHPGTDRLGVSISMIDPADRAALPASMAGLDLPPGGIIISPKAAHDLGVRAGDEVLLLHPQLSGLEFGYRESTVVISAIDDSPYRFVAYMNLADRTGMGLGGIVNSIQLRPAAGGSVDALQQRVAALPGVSSALAASSLSRTMRDALASLDRLFVILQLVIAALVLLVAFNASNLAAEERRREHATMLAFGMPHRRIISMSVVESVVLGGCGVGIGLGFGVALLSWMLNTVFPAAVPDLAVAQAIDLSSYVVTIGIGMLAVTIAPMLNLRHLRAMNLPSTLRYVE